MNILVSACLLGVHCRYSGKGELHPTVAKLLHTHHLIPVWVIFLEYGTNFLYDMELRPVLGLPVAQQIVCQSVVEFTVSHVFAQCYGIRGHLSPSSEAEYSHKGRKQVFFHIVRLSQLLII